MFIKQKTLAKNEREVFVTYFFDYLNRQYSYHHRLFDTGNAGFVISIWEITHQRFDNLFQRFGVHEISNFQ